MTKYLFKLARRMASAFASAGIVLLAACSEAAPRDFLGPDPSNPPPSSGPVSLQIAPKTGAISANQPLQFRAWGRTAAGDSIPVAASWTASGGQIGPDGVFRSAAGGSFTVQAFAVGKPHLTDAATVQVEAPLSIFSGLQVGPTPAAVPMGGTLTFHAHAPLATGGMTVPSVTWTASGGTISPTGTYSAGMAPGSFQVVASTMDGAWSDTVTVLVQAASLQALAVSPAALTVSSGELVDFAVTGQWNDGSTSPPAVQWTSTAGAISASGRLTAGGTPGVFQVVASHGPSGRADTALVTVMPAVSRIEVTPRSTQLQPGAQKSFSAMAVRTDGVVLPVAVTWSATGGTISASGVYSAGSALGSFRIIARYLGGGFADTAEVAIVAPAATLTGLSLTPGTATAGSGAPVQFNVVPTWSDGSSALPALVWSATGGTVTGDGTWTAPVQAGSYQVVVRHPGSGLADTATVTVTEAPRVTAVTITQQASSIQTGGTRQFTAQATWSDGESRPVEWLWSATGGTISVNGLYTAGSLAGQFLVIASCVGCAAADTTGVSVTAAPPPAATLSSLTLSPAQALLNPGDVLPLHVSASWSDGSTQVPDLAWTVGGGTRSGLSYTAGNTAGTFQLIARHAAGTRADTSVITIQAAGGGAATLTSLVLNPSSVTMQAGEQRTLTLAATWSDGSTTVPPVTWNATGGTLNGLTYTAGSTPGSFRVIVSHQDGAKSDTTAVTVVAAPATIVSLSISPDPASVPVGFSLAFGATATLSDSTTSTPAVTWTATGGTISPSGMFTAGPTTGTYQVTATHAGSGLSAVRSVTVTSVGGGVVINQPELPRHEVDVSYPALTGKTIVVASGGNLQSAINSASCGDEVVLAAGAVFTGSYTLPNKGCSAYIVIRGGGPTPVQGTRVSPVTAAGFPKIMAPGSNQSPIVAAPGAGYYRLVGLEVSAAPSAGALNALVRLHVDQLISVSQLPHHIVLDRMYIHGHPTMSLTRCVLMNSAATAVIDSYIDDCHTKGSDSQAIVGWTGTGPYLIENNFLAGAGENVMFGGADPRIAGLVPSDITIRRNHFHKPLSWKGVWTVKNILELKNAQRVLIEDNIFENNWPDGQAGAALLFKSTNQDGAAPWSSVTDVTFRYNLVRNSLSGLNLAANPQGTVVPTARISLEHNIFEQIGSSTGGSGGYVFQLLGNSMGLSDVQIRHTTATLDVNTSHLVGLEGAKGSRLVFVDNFVNIGDFGVKGSGTGSGTASLSAYFYPFVFAGNAIVGASSLGAAYPAGNTWVSTGDLSPLLNGSATDGTYPGADTATVLARLAGVRSF